MPSIHQTILAASFEGQGLMPFLGAEGGGGAGGMFGSFIPIILIILIFYFVLIRPASRERKAREAKVRGIKKHDKIVTNGGIHGTVVSMDEETVTLKVDDKAGVRIKFSRQAIWQVTDPSAEKAGSSDGDKKSKDGDKK